MALRAEEPETRINERMLRHPWERTVYVLCASLNVLFLIGAVWLVLSTPWLDTHPLLHSVRPKGCEHSRSPGLPPSPA